MSKWMFEDCITDFQLETGGHFWSYVGQSRVYWFSPLAGVKGTFGIRRISLYWIVCNIYLSSIQGIVISNFTFVNFWGAWIFLIKVDVLPECLKFSYIAIWKKKPIWKFVLLMLTKMRPQPPLIVFMLIEKRICYLFKSGRGICDNLCFGSSAKQSASQTCTIKEDIPCKIIAAISESKT